MSAPAVAPLPRLSTFGRALLHDTAAHAAVTALTVAADIADPVRAQTARTLYPLIAAADRGDGGEPRRRSPALSTLVADVLAVLRLPNDPRPQLVLALERWLLHPGERSAAELKAAAYALVNAVVPIELTTLEHAWLAGAGVQDAIEVVRHQGFVDCGPQLSLIAAAVATVVPIVWVARELAVTRTQLYRNLRSVDHRAWRELLP